MRKTPTFLLSALSFTIPAGNAMALTRTASATPKKKVVVVTRKFAGSAAQTDRWGYTQVTIVVKKTTTTIGKRRRVKRRITGVSATSPDHTDRSIRINEQAIPILQQETLRAQTANVDLVSGATDTSRAFQQSLQAAILKARRA
jgi:uncharacterized protein with FMN-binding domain